jgi:ribosomal protein S18 acetylase RimI-like enzyme
MSLPILNQHSSSLPPTPQTLVRYFHQTERHWAQHIAEDAQLDVGLAFTNAELSRVWDANRIFDASLPEQTTPAEAVEMVEQHFAERRTQCHAWVVNPSAKASQTGPLVEHLLSRGYRTRSEDILYLQHLPQVPPIDAGGVKVIPARASFRHVRELAAESSRVHGDAADQLVEAAMLHLDDPHYDSLLALRDGRAVAEVGVLAVGELGRIEPLYVAESSRRQGLGRTMMGRALEICSRSLFKHIFLSCLPDNAPAQALYAALGFRKVGEIVSYMAPDVSLK